MPADEARRAGRRPTRTAEQIRSEMLELGLELLAERGLNVGLDTVRLDEVIAAVGAPRASAYRAWSDPDREVGPQALFHEALVTELLREQPGFGGEPGVVQAGALVETLAAVGEVLEKMPDLGELTEEERGFWLRQIHRAGSNANQMSMDDSRLWLCYVAVAAGLASRRTLSANLRNAWSDGEQRMVDRYKELYSSMAELFGFRLRYCYTWEQLDTAAAALAEGLTIRVGVNPHVSGIRRTTGPGGEEQEWTLFAVCFEGLIRQFFEPIPGVQHTDLTHESG